MSGMSETPQTPQDWQKYWQEQGQYENTFAAPGIGQRPSWPARVGASLIDTPLDSLWPLWDKRSQTLHDKVVHTVVMETPKV